MLYKLKLLSENTLFLCLTLQGRVFTIGTELMRNVEEEVNFEDGPFYTFSGFSVSMAAC